MRLVRFGEPGAEAPGVLDADGVLRDASSLTADWDGPSLAPERLAALARRTADLPAVAGWDPGHPAGSGGVRLGAPVARPGKVVCIGVNYADHAAESGMQTPSEPVVFMKDPWTVVGHRDTVLVPRGSTKTDYEVELAVVIGSTARYLDGPGDALAHVAGYAVSHDVSERFLQLEGTGQWDKGKSCETFNPLGPWLLTADEVPDPQALELRLSVNGEQRQHGSTAQMVFGVAALVHYLSQVMVLHPGDVINSGTPAGVALGFPDPKPYLREGDVVECSISGPGADLGAQRTVMGQA
ncbi:fumarylacetoacetate hydrolase family protein [Quadrisphaera sp. KR29]|uniref:fumarylacetoacetate hydrolase family protein n=1 Tax=Quadrisphaera sp. KR29 TaxID=3461391 RepID=UPI004043BACB